MGRHDPHVTGVYKEPRKRFAIVRDGKVVGVFKTAADAKTAMRSLSAPNVPGMQKIVLTLAGQFDREADGPPKRRIGKR